MNAKMVIFSMKEAIRLIDSDGYKGSKEDAEIVKGDLLRAIKSIEGVREVVAGVLREICEDGEGV